MPRFRDSAALALCGLFLAGPGAAFIASNDLVVVPNGQADFVVPYRGKSGPTDFWCAAGDYVMRGLAQSGTTPIYRLSEPPRRSGEGVRFSLSPEGAASGSGLLLLGSDRAALTAAFARQLCDAG